MDSHIAISIFLSSILVPILVPLFFKGAEELSPEEVERIKAIQISKSENYLYWAIVYGSFTVIIVIWIFALLFLLNIFFNMFLGSAENSISVLVGAVSVFASSFGIFLLVVSLSSVIIWNLSSKRFKDVEMKMQLTGRIPLKVTYKRGLSRTFETGILLLLISLIAYLVAFLASKT